MPKQNIQINFQKGINTKSDSWQNPIDQFQSLQNSIFQTGGLLQKRNGYGPLATLNSGNSYLTTLSENLISIGNTVSAYSSSLNEWITKGTLQPCSLNVLPLIRNNLNQTQADCAIANGLVLTVFTENNSGVTRYLYAIADAVTGQNIVQPSAIPVITSGAISGTSRAYVVGSYFVIVSQVTVAGVKHLQYASIPTNNPVNITTNVSNISLAQSVTSETYVAVSSNPGWDAVSINSASNNALVVAYNSTTGAQGIHIAALTVQQISTNSATTTIAAFANAAYIGAIVSICADLTASPNIFYVSFWNNATTDAYTLAVYVNFGGGTITTQFAPQKVVSAVATANLASAAQNGVCTVFSEVSQNYSYVATASNFINGVTVSSAGVVGTPYVVIRSVGLASKACIVNSVMYFLAAYQSTYQPSYFLINASTCTSALPVIVSKLAYQNGGGYVALGLPNVIVNTLTMQMPYLFKDDVEALNTLNNPQQTTAGGIYSQTGINLVSFTIATQEIDSAEIASSLHISGGYLGMFDGYLPVEHNFFLFPEPVVVSGTSGGSMDPQVYYYIATYEWTDQNGLAYRSAPSIPVAVTLTSNTAVVVNLPTLRLTAKVANAVKIVVYRWSTSNQVYYQLTSITLPKLNSTTTDSITFTDTVSDGTILGNNLLYTTGGVAPNCNGPACNGIMNLFNASLVVIDAERPNTAWISKTVIPSVPVEMSQGFTIFVSPTQGTIKSLGPITACAPMDDKFIFFFAQGASYINGQAPAITGATAVGCSLGNYSQPIFITSIVGCTNQASIVLTSAGLMFQSDKGIWLMDRNLQTSYIGAPVEAFNASTVTSAAVIPETNFVVFTLDTGEMLMYDYFYNQWGTFVGATAISSCIYQNLHTILDEYGNILQETPGQYLDNGNPVLMSFTTAWINFAGVQGFERFYWFYLLGRYLSPHFINCGIAYNYNPSFVSQPQIAPVNFSSAVASPFGDQPAPFGSPVDLENWLIHSQYQKCQSFQISIQEQFNPAFGTVAGPGFTLSGLNIVANVKRGSRPIDQSQTTG